jgi:FtsZ-interacting cell division protein YlmF
MAGSEPNRRVFVDFQPMSPEDMQRTMQFLLHQQVTGAVVGLTSNLEKLGVRVDQMTGAVVGFTGAAHRRDEPAGDLPSRILERIP